MFARPMSWVSRCMELRKLRHGRNWSNPVEWPTKVRVTSSCDAFLADPRIVSLQLGPNTFLLYSTHVRPEVARYLPFVCNAGMVKRRFV
jgi:hypothetical protein